jgi:hypothetical protein
VTVIEAVETLEFSPSASFSSSLAPATPVPSNRAVEVETADPLALMGRVAGLSRGEIETMSAGQAEAFVIACERVKAVVDGRQVLALDTLAARVDEDVQRRAQQEREDARARVAARKPGPDVHGLVASLLAPGLHCSTRAVRARLEAARRLVRTAESTFRALWDGDLDRPRADAVTEAAQQVDPDLWERFEALVLETSVDEVTGEVALVSQEVQALSRAQLARRAGRIARTLDPESQQRAAALAHDRRRVLIRPDRHQPGLAAWTAHLPTEVSQRMASAVDALAGQYAKAHPGTGLDGHRADALADLVLGNATITTTVELLIPVLPAYRAAAAAPVATKGALGQLNPLTATLVPVADTDGQAVSWVIPGVVDDPRHGTLLHQVVATMLADPDVLIRLARLDPDGSLTQDPTAYRPTASTRRRVRSRDGHCRFPGCHTPAARCDLDHVVPHPVGPTVHTNLIALCRTHHRFKHHAGWRPDLADDGTVTWTAPDRRTWTTHPAPHDLRAELNLLKQIDPGVAHDLRRGWVPGLPPGMSLADLALTEAALLDDPPDADVTPEPPPDWEALDWKAPDAYLPEPVSIRAGSSLERHFDHLIALAA